MDRAAVAVKRGLASAARALIDLALPPTCPATDEAVDAPGRLSAAAWAKLTFLAPPWCARCGAPFAFDLGPEPECAACVARPLVVGRARAALAYDAGSRALILSLKHAARTDGLEVFAGWMATAGRDALTEADVLAPVPLHRSRLRRRGFNQSGLLAAALARRTGLAVDHDLLARARRTDSQAGKSATERAANVAGAFRMRAPDRVRGARIVLIDDVFTTGATVNACAKVLKRAGAARVDAVTLARVVRPRDATI